jgi:quinol monooxygenase YgiN
VSVAVLIEHRARRGCHGEVRVVWERLLRPAIETNDGHEAYSYMFDADDPDIIRAFQRHTDDEAAAACLKTPAYGAHIAAVEDLLVGPPPVLRCEGHPDQANPAARHTTMIVFPGESHEYRTARDPRRGRRARRSGDLLSAHLPAMSWAMAGRQM